MKKFEAHFENKEEPQTQEELNKTLITIMKETMGRVQPMKVHQLEMYFVPSFKTNLTQIMSTRNVFPNTLLFPSVWYSRKIGLPLS